MLVGLTGLGDPEVLSQLGVPTSEAYNQQYINYVVNKSGTAVDLTIFPFYMSFVFFRMAAICQGVYKRAISGRFYSKEMDQVG